MYPERATFDPPNRPQAPPWIQMPNRRSPSAFRYSGESGTARYLHEGHREDCQEASSPDPAPCLQRSRPRNLCHTSLIVENAVAPASFHDSGLRVPITPENEYVWPALGEVQAVSSEGLEEVRMMQRAISVMLLMLGLFGADVVVVHRADVVESSRNDTIQAPRWGDIEKGEVEAPRV